MTIRAPKQPAPALSCDCHFHVFGPYDRYPMNDGRSYSPPPAPVPAYLQMAEALSKPLEVCAQMNPKQTCAAGASANPFGGQAAKVCLGLQRMVVVQASVYGSDNAVTMDAIAQFGPHRARGVAVIDDSFDAAALRQLHQQGIRGVRFNMVSGNGTPEDQLEALARRVAELGWHIQIYADGAKLLEIGALLVRLPVEVVIDHCGGVRADLDVGHPQFKSLLRLLDSGRCVGEALPLPGILGGGSVRRLCGECQALAAAAPDRCVWGTDWPHPQMDPSPEAGSLLDQLFDSVPDAKAQQRVLVDNPARLYGF